MTIRPPKYFYMISVQLKDQVVLKFGVSNRYERRFKEYKDPLITGKYIETIALFKTNDAKKLETVLKWYLKQFFKPVFKQEYFDLQYSKFILKCVIKLHKYFNWRLIKLK